MLGAALTTFMLLTASPPAVAPVEDPTDQTADSAREDPDDGPAEDADDAVDPESTAPQTNDLQSTCTGQNCERAWTGPEPRYWGGQSFGDHTNLRNGGLGLLVAGGGMAVGSLLAGTVNMCGRDGAHGTNCARDTRVQLAIGFGATSVVLTTVGAVMFGVAQQRRRLDLAFGSDGRGASFSLSGRF